MRSVNADRNSVNDYENGQNVKVNLDEFNKRVEQGYIRRQTLDNLTIWNYSTKAAYEQAWDEYTTFARGLITEPDGTIHSRSFSKFWNLGESHGPTLEELPKEDPVVTLKLDGFLGLSYWHDHVMKIASRGSFTSEYAVWATEWLHTNTPKWFWTGLWREKAAPFSQTWVFEILYPHRRIVVDNSKQFGLMLLTSVINDTGEEYSRSLLESAAVNIGVPIVPVFPTHTLQQCVDLGKTIKGTECEGFVVHYPSTGLRVKIKGDDYCKIHRLVTRLTKKRIWEILACDPATGKVSDVPATIAENQLSELAVIVPEEYSRWIRSTATELTKEHRIVLAKVARTAAEVWQHLYPPAGTERKDVVFKLQAKIPDLWKEALNIVDGRADKAVASIWKRLEPAYEVPVLRDGEDE